MKVILLIFMTCVFPSFGWGSDICPERDDYFCMTPDMAPNSIIDSSSFYNIPTKIISLFSNELLKTQKPLQLNAQWESPFFGAGVGLYNNQFSLMILGGTTRAEKMTLDAYAAIVCHEIGHILGGYPFQAIEGSEWSSSEGQSDFFAASICLPRFFKSQGISRAEINARVEKAGFEMTKSFSLLNQKYYGDLAEQVIRHQADSTIVDKNLAGYPSLQCRYENFRNSLQRPRCWFKQ